MSKGLPEKGSRVPSSDKNYEKTNVSPALPSQPSHLHPAACGENDGVKVQTRDVKVKSAAACNVTFSSKIFACCEGARWPCVCAAVEGSGVPADRCTRSQRWSAVTMATVWAEGAASILSLQKTDPRDL